MVREVGRRLFDCKVTCEVLKVTQDIASVIAGIASHSFKEYVKFELHISENNPEEGAPTSRAFDKASKAKLGNAYLLL